MVRISALVLSRRNPDFSKTVEVAFAFGIYDITFIIVLFEGLLSKLVSVRSSPFPLGQVSDQEVGAVLIVSCHTLHDLVATQERRISL